MFVGIPTSIKLLILVLQVEVETMGVEAVMAAKVAEVAVAEVKTLKKKVSPLLTLMLDLCVL
jgi:hypothetical protein